ncbi:hypothetical protein [Actinophytocola sp.]|uniref:hypothetical protein n=1 Tax=Actinophytocola sp. TaxID=1872138 RepID=UPI00389AE603
MTMVMELASFRIHEDAEDKLLAERPAMIQALRRRFPACLAAFLTRQDDGGWLDVLLWRGRAEAQEAAELVDTVPEAREWFRHIAESGGLRHVTVKDSWVGDALG